MPAACPDAIVVKRIAASWPSFSVGAGIVPKISLTMSSRVSFLVVHNKIADPPRAQPVSTICPLHAQLQCAGTAEQAS